MKKFIFALSAIIILSACNSDGAEESVSKNASDMHRGEIVYKQTCIGCHGEDLKGRGSSGKDLSHIGSEKSPEYIQSVIENGTRSMPSNLVEGEDLDAVVEWLSEQK